MNAINMNGNTALHFCYAYGYHQLGDYLVSKVRGGPALCCCAVVLLCCCAAVLLCCYVVVLLCRCIVCTVCVFAVGVLLCPTL